LYALRGLAMYAQKKGNVYKPWQHAGKEEWKSQNRIVKLYFSAPDYRDTFRIVAKELLPDQWTPEGDELDNEPLPP
ncbi:MAG: hypothetical protein ACREJC_01810, partial [Tepidisphaeraceae bacterium]